MSEHKSLAEALLAFKAEAPTLPKDKTTPHFKSKYTGLDTIADKIDPLLQKHGLVWVACPGHENGHPTLDYRLLHAATGEAMSGSMLLMLDKENSQGLGSALTYCRRYAKVAVLDLVADEDDDGNRASTRQRAAGPPHGPEADGDLKAQIGPALGKILGGDLERAKQIYKKVTADLGVNYMPVAAAQALITAAGALDEPPWVGELPAEEEIVR